MAEADQKKATELRILDAALDIFSLKGKDGARMQEIADAAGINKAMLHYYFRSKDNLYESVFRRVMGRFQQHDVHAFVDTGSFAETLRSFIDRFVQSMNNEPAVLRLLVNENIEGGATMGRIISEREHASSPPSIMRRTIKKAVDRGEIRPVDPDHALLSIISCCLFFFIWAPTIQIKFEYSRNWDAFVEERKAHIFDLLYHGMASRSAIERPNE